MDSKTNQLRFLVQSHCSQLLGKTTEEEHEGGAAMSCHDVMNNVTTKVKAGKKKSPVTIFFV